VVELYRAWRGRPEAVEPSWREFFAALDDAARAHLDALAGAPRGAAPDALRAAALDSIKAMALIDAYRTRGHLAARLDPLGLKPIGTHPELEPASYGFGEGDFDRPIYLGGELGLGRRDFFSLGLDYPYPDTVFGRVSRINSGTLSRTNLSYSCRSSNPMKGWTTST